MARKRKASTNGDVHPLLKIFLSKGEKGILGKEGWIRIERDYDYEEDEEVYFPVSITGVHVDGCNTGIKVTPINGRGTILLKSFCQFKESLEQVEQELADEKAHNEFNSLKGYLDGSYNSPVSTKRNRVLEYIREKVPQGFKNPIIAAEAEIRGIDLNKDSTVTGQHIGMLRHLALSITHPEYEKADY